MTILSFAPVAQTSQVGSSMAKVEFADSVGPFALVKQCVEYLADGVKQRHLRHRTSLTPTQKRNPRR